MNNTQICRACKQNLPILEFTKNSMKCKTCIKIYYDEWKRRHPGYYQQWKEKNPSYHKLRYLKIIAEYGNEEENLEE